MTNRPSDGPVPYELRELNSRDNLNSKKGYRKVASVRKSMENGIVVPPSQVIYEDLKPIALDSRRDLGYRQPREVSGKSRKSQQDNHLRVRSGIYSNGEISD
jgi:hypothetical protein